jgi:hypothetical protein
MSLATRTSRNELCHVETGKADQVSHHSFSHTVARACLRRHYPISERMAEKAKRINPGSSMRYGMMDVRKAHPGMRLHQTFRLVSARKQRGISSGAPWFCICYKCVHRPGGGTLKSQKATGPRSHPCLEVLLVIKVDGRVPVIEAVLSGNEKGGSFALDLC